MGIVLFVLWCFSEVITDLRNIYAYGELNSNISICQNVPQYNNLLNSCVLHILQLKISIN
jgi:hypothetical protein